RHHRDPGRRPMGSRRHSQQRQLLHPHRTPLLIFPMEVSVRKTFLSIAAAAAVLMLPAFDLPISAAPAVAQTSAGPCGTLATPPSYTHVIWVWMENHSYDTIIGNSQAPYINTLAGQCGLATNYHNISHPSLPNYIAGTSGLGLSDLKKFDTDCSPSKHC